MTAPLPTSLWLDASFGAAGDMILGALIGLAPDPASRGDEIARQLECLNLNGWSLQVEPAERCSISATRAVVDAASLSHHRSWSSIDALLAAADLPDPVVVGARKTFRRLGEVEADIHQVTIDEVHFHEVGALDAIVDIVGSWLALHGLDTDQQRIDEVVCGPIGLGSGTVPAAHGTLPLPAPATAQLLIGAPIHPLEADSETVTPTGAALLSTMASRWGPIPAGTLAGISRGAGGRDPQSHPNVVSCMLVSQSPALGDAASADLSTQSAFELTTNLDDVAPELVAHVIDLALSAGAHDAWSNPITMKKGRSAVALTVLCADEQVGHLEQLILGETGSLGLRIRPVHKRILDRHVEVVNVEGHPIRVKVGPWRAKPEFEDVAAAAQALQRPFREIAAAAHACIGQASQSRPDST